MPFTLTHGVISFFIISLFTKDKRLWAIAFAAGMLPDLDGIPILYDMDLFYAIHHTFFHPPIYGLILGLIAALALNHFLKMDKLRVFLAFAAGFILHPVGDLFFTDWPVMMLWPFSNQEHIFPYFLQYNWVLVALIPVMVAFPFVRDCLSEKFRKPAAHKSNFSE